MHPVSKYLSRTDELCTWLCVWSLRTESETDSTLMKWDLIKRVTRTESKGIITHCAHCKEEADSEERDGVGAEK